MNTPRSLRGESFLRLFNAARATKMRAMPNAARTSSNTQTFAGFDDYVEVFCAGEQTDSEGNTARFTEAQLDQIIANHNPEHPAPAVLGHPKHDDPAYAWVESLKRDGSKLLAKFSQVVPAFEAAVKEGRFRNRSVKLLQTDKGLALGHVGFLGAALPAVAGLKPMAFSASADGVTYEFSMSVPGAWHISLMARAFRKLRELVIAKFGVEEADSAMPEWTVSELEAAARSTEEAAANTPAAAFAARPHPSPLPLAGEGEQRKEPAVPDLKVSTFTQADLDAAATAAREAEAAKHKPAADELAKLRFTQRMSAAQADVKVHVDAGRVSPAQASGMAEFVAGLREQPQEFTFAAADGAEKKEDRAAWFMNFLAALPQQIKPGQVKAGADSEPGAAVSAFSAPRGFSVDPAQLAKHEKALAYMQQNKSTDYVAAVMAVERAQ